MQAVCSGIAHSTCTAGAGIPETVGKLYSMSCLLLPDSRAQTTRLNDGSIESTTVISGRSGAVRIRGGGEVRTPVKHICRQTATTFGVESFPGRAGL